MQTSFKLRLFLIMSLCILHTQKYKNMYVHIWVDVLNCFVHIECVYLCEMVHVREDVRVCIVIQ